jgi:predicted nucleic acid-binding Zn ribbon protein
MSWLWHDSRDGLRLLFGGRNQARVVEYNYRRHRRSRLQREVQAEFASFGELSWDRVELGVWYWLCFVRRRHVFEELGTVVARPCTLCRIVFVPTLRSHRRYCSDRCKSVALGRCGLARIKASPDAHKRYLQKVRSLRAQAQRERETCPELRAGFLAAQRERSAKVRRKQGMRPSCERRAAVESAYGDWTVVREVAETPGVERRLLCRCKCGVERAVRLVHLRSGASARCKACGARAQAERRRAAKLVATFDPAQLFHCTRLHSTLSRGSCAARFRECEAPSATDKRQQKLNGRSLACARCETGAAHARAEPAAVQVVKLRVKQQTSRPLVRPRCLGCGEPVPSGQHRVCSTACADTLAMEKRWSTERQLPEWITPSRFSAVQVDV